MKKNSMYSVFLGIAGVSLLIAFNNCSNSFQAADPSKQYISANESLNSMNSLTDMSNGEQGSTSQDSQNSGQRTPSNLVFPGFASGGSGSVLKVHVATSLNGPWVENGRFCRNQQTYVRTSGVNLTVKTKGCASPSSSRDCLDVSKHRDFSASEVSTGNIISVVSVADSNAWPIGDYTLYVSQNGVVKAAGTARLENCGSSTSTPAQTGVNAGNGSGCSWSNWSFGGGSTRKDPATACTPAMHYKKAVDGNGVQQTCTCANMPAPDAGPTYGFLAAPTYSEYRLTMSGAITGNGAQAPHPVNSQCAYGASYTGYQNCESQWRGEAPNRYLICQGWSQACTANPN